VSAGDPVLEVSYRDSRRLEDALLLITQAISVGDERPLSRPLIVGEVIGAAG
jgi:hypothetical protein